MENNYKYSGKISPEGTVLGLITGCLAAAVLSVPYAYTTIFIPLVYFNVLATLGLGVAAGFCASWGARKCNMQNVFMYMAVGLVTGLCAVYFSWVYWVFVMSGHEWLVFSPLGLISVAQEVMVEGTWGMTSGGNITGLALAAIWVVEAVMIVGATIYMARKGLTSFICCPDCTVWFKDPTRTLSYEMPESISDLTDALKQLNFKALHDLTPVQPGETGALLLEIYFCPACSKFGSFDLQRLEHTVKNGKVETKKTMLIERQLLPKEGLLELTQ
jgi:hypothetical protein